MNFLQNATLAPSSSTRFLPLSLLFLLLTAYLITETEKERTSGNSNVVLRACRINRGRAPRIHDRGCLFGGE
jgi:hypothetical protein